MSHRRRARLRLGGVLLATAAVVSSVVVRSGPTLGGLEGVSLDSVTAGTRHVTSVQVEWNRDARDSTRPSSVRLSTGDGEVFEAGDMVDVTAVGAGSDSCSEQTTLITRSPLVDLGFSACGVMLWDVQGVSVSVSEGGAATAFEGDARAPHRSLASFDGPVVQRDAAVKPGYSISRQDGAEMLTTLRISVGDVTADQLVGRRLISILSTASAEPTTYTGTVGTTASNQGIWVQNDPNSAEVIVIADLVRLAGGQAPRVADGAQYRMVLLQPQRLGTGQTPDNRHALITAVGTIDG